MSDKSLFLPEKLSILEFKLPKLQIEMPDDFFIEKIAGYQLQHTFSLAFNLADKLAKTDLILQITTESQGKNQQEARAYIHLTYIFHVANMEELTKVDADNSVIVDEGLSGAFSSVTFSTSRGVLLTKLPHTAFANFILPIINANKLLEK